MSGIRERLALEDCWQARSFSESSMLITLFTEKETRDGFGMPYGYFRPFVAVIAIVSRERPFEGGLLPTSK